MDYLGEINEISYKVIVIIQKRQVRETYNAWYIVGAWSMMTFFLIWQFSRLVMAGVIIAILQLE